MEPNEPGPHCDWIWFQHALLPDGWARGVRIGIRAGTIVHVDRDAGPRAGDEHGGIGVPGLPNLHSHAFQRAMAGFAETRDVEGNSFWTWRAAMYRFVDRLTPDHLEAVAALAFVEMLESGFTRVGEFHYLHHAPGGSRYDNVAELSLRLVAAAHDTGIGLTLLPVLYRHSGFGGQPAHAGQCRFVNDPDAYTRLVEQAAGALARLDGGVLGIAAHSLRAVSPRDLDAAVEIAAGRPIHLHIAEQTAEVEACLAWSGARPVEWLLDHAPVGREWCLVHATHVDDAELAGIARTGAVVGLCPITEANLGDGLFPAGRFLALGGRIGIGSDSNVRIDAAEELCLLEYGQRLRDRSRSVLADAPGNSTGGRLFRAACDGGAALGVEAPALAPGAVADVVGLDAGHASLLGHAGDARLDAWVFSARTAAVRDVWCRGRRVVSEGRHVLRDRVVSRYGEALLRLLA